MTRLRADFLLLIGAVIWGTAFVAQKIGMDSIGPFLFVGVRMAISSLVLAPFAFIEFRKSRNAPKTEKTSVRFWLLCLCLVFTSGVIAQQVGIVHTSVTNAGFLTSLYVLFTPIFAWGIFKMHPNLIVWFAGPLSVLGVFFLGEGSFSKLSNGDLYVVLSAMFFALHTVLISVVVTNTRQPYSIAFMQFFICAIGGFAVAFAVETIDWSSVYKALPALLYTGVLSGGLAYTFQIIAQQYTPASDASVIVAAEALFAALAGAMLLGDRLSLMAWAGCGCIFAAVLMVELWPVLKKSAARSPRETMPDDLIE